MSRVGTMQAAWRWYDCGYLLCMLVGALCAAWPVYRQWMLFPVALGSAVIGVWTGWCWIHSRHPICSAVCGVAVWYFGIGGGLALLWYASDLPRTGLALLRTVLTGPLTTWVLLFESHLPVGSAASLLLPFSLVTTFGTALFCWGRERSAGTQMRWSLALLPHVLFGPLFLVGAGGGRRMEATSAAALGAVLAGITLLWARRNPEPSYQVAALPGIFSVRNMIRSALFVVVIPSLVVGLWAVAPPIQGVSLAKLPRPGSPVPLAAPMRQFRAYFTADQIDRTLFHVSGTDRVRLAVVDARALLETRVPRCSEGEYRASFPVRRGRDPEVVTIRLHGGSGRNLPLPDRSGEVFFSSAVLQERLRVSDALGSATLGSERVPTGTVYRVSSAPQSGRMVTEPSMSCPRRASPVPIPSLRQWMSERSDPATVQGVRAAMRALRERSHLGLSRVPPGPLHTWAPEGFQFAPSDSGQGLRRMEQLFSQMLQSAQRCPSAGRCAVTVGDPSQYAAAGALIAHALSIPARVVIGATVPPDGYVTGRQMTAWLEVQGRTGEWHMVSAEPRTDTILAPEHPAGALRAYLPEDEPPPRSVQEESAAGSGQEKQPERHDSPESQKPKPAMSHAVWVGTGAAVGILVVPPLTRLSRRTVRRMGRSPLSRVRGGWLEYVGTAGALGHPSVGTTRQEVAQSLQDPAAMQLASLADRWVFGPDPPTVAQAKQFWDEVKCSERKLRRQSHRVRRVWSVWWAGASWKRKR